MTPKNHIFESRDFPQVEILEDTWGSVFVENPTLVTPQDRPLAMMAWEIGKDGHCFRREMDHSKKGINKGIMKGIGGFYYWRNNAVVKEHSYQGKKTSWWLYNEPFIRLISLGECGVWRVVGPVFVVRLLLDSVLFRSKAVVDWFLVNFPPRNKIGQNTLPKFGP